MSFDLAVWDADRPPSVQEAEARYERLRAGDDRTGNPSARVAAFLEECERRWPAADDVDAGPWAAWPLTDQRSPSGLVATIRSWAATEMFGEWADMAGRHGLVLYDPQSGVVKIPSRLSFEADPVARQRGWFGRG